MTSHTATRLRGHGGPEHIMRSSKTLAIAVFALAATGLSGCGGPITTTDGARATLYSSIDALSDDSTLVVVGHVVAQESVRDVNEELEFTISTLTVDEVVKSDRELGVGDHIEVRQVSGREDPESEGVSVPPTPLLNADLVYLLYLTPSALPAPLDSQFYITGGNAGAFQSSMTEGLKPEASTTFEAVDPSEGEQLPRTLTLTQAESAAR